MYTSNLQILHNDKEFIMPSKNSKRVGVLVFSKNVLSENSQFCLFDFPLVLLGAAINKKAV